MSGVLESYARQVPDVELALADLASSARSWQSRTARGWDDCLGEEEQEGQH